MSEHNVVGQIGENIACNNLQNEGYVVLYRNWRPKKSHAEVDIVAVDHDSLVFVEVKTRTSDLYGRPVEFVTLKKQKLLIKAASMFIREGLYYGYSYIRFDVVSIMLEKQTHELKSYELIKDAFRPAPKYYS